VRGVKSWLDAGRCVRNGEHGIRIFAPRPWQRPATNDLSGDPGDDDVKRVVSFTIVHVFDVSQTNLIPGHPHPWKPPIRYEAAATPPLPGRTGRPCSPKPPPLI
jgi:hypothetical protein